MVTRRELDAILRLAGMVRDADLVQLRVAQARRDAARQVRLALDKARRNAVRAAADLSDLARRASAEAHALQLALRQEQAAMEEAVASAALDDARAAAAKSTGRADAAKDLAMLHATDLRRSRLRRAEAQARDTAG